MLWAQVKWVYDIYTRNECICHMNANNDYQVSYIYSLYMLHVFQQRCSLLLKHVTSICDKTLLKSQQK